MGHRITRYHVLYKNLLSMVLFNVFSRTLSFQYGRIKNVNKAISYRYNNINTHRRVATLNWNSVPFPVESNHDVKKLNTDEFSSNIEKETKRSSKIHNYPSEKKERSSRSSTLHGLYSAKARKNKVKGKNDVKSMYARSRSVPDSLIQVVKEIHQQPRISPTEEKIYATKAQEALRLETIHENLKERLKREPTDEEYCAAAGKFNIKALNLIVEEGIDAKNRLVTSNLRMVQSVVNMYLRNGLGSQYNAGDLMQEGMMALIGSAENFDPKKGFRFSTYAMYGIRASVKRAQLSQSLLVRTPERYQETWKKALSRAKELEIILGRECTMSELADDLNIPLGHLELSMDLTERKFYSLDAELRNPQKYKNEKDSRKKSMYDVLTSMEDKSLYRSNDEKLMKDDLINFLKSYLSPVEVQILMLRFGVLDEQNQVGGVSKSLTYREIGEITGMKIDKIRRTIKRCLSELKDVIDPEWEKMLIL